MHAVERMRVFRALALVAGAFVLLVHAALAQGVTPSAVVDTYERAWGSQDLDAAVGQFADTAVITLESAGSHSITGRVQIRAFLESAHLHTVPQLTSARQVDGNTVMWSERTDGQVLAAADVTARAVVDGGKIQSLLYRPGRLVPSTGRPAPVLSVESAGTTLAAVVLLGLGLLSLACARVHVSSSSKLRGRLMHDLGQWRRLPVRQE